MQHTMKVCANSAAAKVAEQSHVFLQCVDHRRPFNFVHAVSTERTLSNTEILSSTARRDHASFKHDSNIKSRTIERTVQHDIGTDIEQEDHTHSQYHPNTHTHLSKSVQLTPQTARSNCEVELTPICSTIMTPHNGNT